jgi:LuxR family maltose regulon positive regulatory protein
LRFTSSEAAEFLNQVMSLDLSAEEIGSLETRTEGWIAGLHMAALSMQGLADTTGFIKSFTGSHHFVLDYLVEEVLQQQSENVQTFLLKTAVLDRLTGSLCDGLTGKENGRQTLEYLEKSNLFIVPLDNERRWYRYHHLFADLLRQRLQQSAGTSPGDVAELHSRASVWYEENGLWIEAFHHATAANDVERAERLIEGDGLPLHWHGAASLVLNWLASLPTAVLDARPSLWVTYASALIFAGQTSSIEQKLQAAEAALQGAEADDKTQDLVGHIAAIRGMMAVNQHQVETIISQSQRALKLLHPDNLPVRTAASWTLGYAYELQGDRAVASRAYTEVIANSQASGNFMFTIAATTSLGNIQEAENQLYLAAETHQRALKLAGDPPLPFACASYIGLARVLYEWNDLDTAQQHGQLSAQLARQIEGVDTPAICGVFLARLKLAQGDIAGADALLTEAEQFVRQHNFMFRMPDVAAAQVLILLRRDDLAAAAHLAEQYDLPISQARVHLAQGDTSLALALLEPLRKQVETKGWADERLKVMILQAVAHHAHGDNDQAVQLLRDALALAEPGGFIRIFVDEGPPMAHLLYKALTRGIAPEYAQKLLAAFPIAEQGYPAPSKTQSAIIEPLSQRELEVLELIAQGLSNREISERLFLALSTVKRHNGNIFGKLEVRRRTEAVARARELGLL